MAWIAKTSIVAATSPLIEFKDKPSDRYRSTHWAGNAVELDRSDVPLVAELKSSHKTVTDFFGISGKIAFSTRAKELVEGIDPNIRQFISFNVHRASGKKPILDSNGNLLSTPYFIFNSLTSIDAVCLERSELSYASSTNINANRVAREGPGGFAKVLLRSDLIAKLSLWQGKYQFGSSIFMSDALHSLVRDHGFKGLEFSRLVEV